MQFSAILSVLFVTLSVIGCQQSAPMQTQETVSPGHAGEKPAPNTAVLWVRGMGCPQCANNVDVQLLKIPGVQTVKVDLSNGKVVAQLAPNAPPTRDQLTKAIKETGFTLVRIDM